MKKYSVITSALAVSLAAWASLGNASRGAPAYALTDLGVLPGYNEAEAVSINSSGMVAGNLIDPNSGQPHPFVWTNGTMNLLRLPTGYLWARATAINDSGVAVGTMFDGLGDYYGFVSSGGSAQFGTPVASGSSATDFSTADGINNSGTVIGLAYFKVPHATDLLEACIFPGTAIGNVAGHLSSEAYAINNLGQIIVEEEEPNELFLYGGGILLDLGFAAPPSSISYPISFNDAGQIVGELANSFHPFLYSGGRLTDLSTQGINPEAVLRGLNNAGQIVGSAGGVAFVYSGGVVYNLNNLSIAGGTGWLFEDARSINNSGQIVGTAYTPAPNRLSHAVLLTPTNTDASPGLPTVTVQPQSQTINLGSSVAFNVAATGATATYQWYKNGGSIAGATGRTLFVAAATAASLGTYTCVVSNTNGAVVSAPAVLTVANSTNPGRLINLSILSVVQGSLTMGYVIGGAGTSGSESLLIRATGPALALAPFNVPGVMTDPTLTVVRQAGSATVATNAGWGSPASNQATVNATDGAVGAFTLTDPKSLDSALVETLPISPGGYTATVAGKSGDSGYALTEVYDATPSGAYTPATPRLVNLSCLTNIAAGGTLTVGFVVGGATSKTVLVRVSGPTLTAPPFGLSGTMPDPKLSVQPLSSPPATLAANAGWGGDPEVAAVAAIVGAFAFASTSTLDSAVVVTLAPGIPYTVQATSASGAGGEVLVEIYEVP